ncbi:hypothetical protein FJQ98_15995 [Lysinibacillus agricola]|uniref:Uncharacterized protein n=1 Tax=Lysinibacillus agricola TaxID=2590012 RepID=A0ABX7AMM5_9BACI|nr:MULTISPECIES: hypothetical protein [Lysinibacillus]KOS61553.1 hypothetical protein AN161_18365 [Lysinibacillus sp. FJAT-14222]QQP10747.1 hypothetical protein FJQ98_15995 [Lysinibacillus agricola]
MVETPVEEKNAVQLTEDYRITSDQRNIILQKRYQKREGRGKNSPLIDSYDYKDVGYFGNLKSLLNGLVNYEVPLSATMTGKIEDAHLQIEKLRDEIVQHVLDKVTILQYNPKLKENVDGDAD